MSHRYHRGGTYQTRNPLAVHSPLRSVSLFRPGAAVFGAAWYDGTWNQARPLVVVEPVAAPAPAPVDAARELRNAEVWLREVVRVYDFARREIGDANRTHREAVIVAGHVVSPAVRFTPERIRERKSYAFRLFNKRRSELAAAKRRLAAARIALGLPVETVAVVTPVAAKTRTARIPTSEVGLRAVA